MNIPILLLSLVAVAAVSGTAFADSACEKKARKLLATHLSQVGKIESEFAKKREKLVSRYLKKLGDEQKAADFRVVVERIVDRNIPPKNTAEASKKLISGLEALIELDEEYKDCGSFYKFRYYSKSIKKGYTAAMEDLHAEIEDRIDIESLPSGSGLAVIAAYSNGYAGRIFINRRGAITGNFRIGPLSNQQYFRVIELPEGEYNWGKVSLGEGGSRHAYYDFNDDDLVFRIVAGKLNYTGVFIFESAGGRARAQISDRGSITTQMLEERYPELLNRYEVVNGLVPEDTFMDFYMDEKNQPQEP